MSTHEDALQASRSVMKRALSEIAWYSNQLATRKLAHDALKAEAAAYANGVRKAVD